MKAVVQQGRKRQQFTNMDTQAKGANADLAAPHYPQSRLITTERDSKGVLRIRLRKTTEKDTTVLVENRQQRLTITRTAYLDGHERSISTASSYYRESEKAVDLAAKDAGDFGRLNHAASQLSAAMAKFGPDNPPSPEQTIIFVRSYQNILEWRRAARRKLDHVEGQIDMVEAMLGRML